MFVVSSTPVNESRLLLKVAPWKERVAVLEKTSRADEVVTPRFEKLPKRDIAVTTAHRCAAQYGQYSAPTYSTLGFPSAVSGVPVMWVGGFTPVPVPTASKVAAGIVDKDFSRAVPAGVGGGRAAAR